MNLLQVVYGLQSFAKYIWNLLGFTKSWFKVKV